MMKPNEIKKAFECCPDYINCLSCPCFSFCGCTPELFESALAYIEQLETKVEMLNNECRDTRRDLLNEIIRLEDQLETAKADAVKEFSERLKATFPNNSHWVKPREKIDSILKEMVGDEE